MKYRGIVCGPYTEKTKRCLHCKKFIMWGVGGGDCASNHIKGNKIGDRYRSTNDKCKYFKRESQIFDKNGRIKNEELYMEMMM